MKNIGSKVFLIKIFTNIRQKYYDDNGKRVYYELIRELNPLGLALFYMDDGYRTNDSGIFSTCSFTLERIKYYSKSIKRELDLNTSVNKAGEIYLYAESFRKMKTIIEPYVLDCMKYKLNPYRVLNKSDELRETPEVDNPEPS